LKRSFIREILEHTNSNTISFAGGLPDPSLFPTKELKECTKKVFEDTSSLQYGNSMGYLPLRNHIAQFYTKKGFPTSKDNILITTGSQQALDIICRYYSGSTITIERPSYLGALNIFKLNNMLIQTVKLTKNGIDINLLKKSIKNSKLTYLIPDFQNPSSICYTKFNRLEVAKLLDSSNTILIEDSPYSQLYFETQQKPISWLLEDKSYHIGSFSKILSPSLRVGWIRANKKLLEPLVAYKEAMDLHTSVITQKIIYEYLKDAQTLELHLNKLRVKYKEKMLYFSKELDCYLPSFSYEKPKGGMFIYGALENIDTSKFLQKCLQNGVVYVPGIEFGGEYNEIRFNFTNNSLQDITKGLKRIKKSLEETI